MYLVDSNIFIQAKNFYYAFDICPGFWEWMDAAVANDDVRSITKVYDELAGGDDELAQWVKRRKGDGRFLGVTDTQTQMTFRHVAAEVQRGPWRDPAKADFLSKADPWLVAKAKALGATVVTHEKADANARKKVPLPTICAQFGVHTIDTFSLLRGRAAFGLLTPA